MQDPIRFVGNIEPSDMFRAYMLAWRNTWQMWFRRLFFASLGVLALVLVVTGWRRLENGNRERAYFSWGLSAATVAFLVTSEISWRRRIKRALNTSVFDHESGEARIEESGVTLADNQAKLQVAWERFEGFRVNDDVAVYYVSFPRTFLAFFRRLAASPDEWKRFLDESEKRLKRL